MVNFINENYLLINHFLKVYKGFLFDSRISDNSWVKAKVYNFHDEDDFLYKLFWLDNHKYTGYFLTLNNFILTENFKLNKFKTLI